MRKFITRELLESVDAETLRQLLLEEASDLGVVIEPLEDLGLGPEVERGE